MKALFSSRYMHRQVIHIGLILSIALLMGCSDGTSHSGDRFRGTWLEYTDGSPGIKVVISNDSLTASGPGEEELFSGFIQGPPFRETSAYSITKNQDGNDVIEVMIEGRDCTLQPVDDSMNFHCFSGTDLFLSRSA